MPSKKNNPRYHNGNFRRKVRARFRAMNAPCHICGGEIHYEEPSNHNFPLSFVVDEVLPCSRWKEFGYSSAEAACLDPNNLAPAHYACNAMKSNKVGFEGIMRTKAQGNVLDGEW